STSYGSATFGRNNIIGAGPIGGPYTYSASHYSVAIGIGNSVNFANAQSMAFGRLNVSKGPYVNVFGTKNKGSSNCANGFGSYNYVGTPTSNGAKSSAFGYYNQIAQSSG